MPSGGEFDLEGPEPLWIIPAEKMKMRREHRVPLSFQAMKVLEQVPLEISAKGACALRIPIETQEATVEDVGKTQLLNVLDLLDAVTES